MIDRSKDSTVLPETLHNARHRTLRWLAIPPALAYASSTPQQQLIGALSWRSIGPYIGGRVVAVAGVPSNSGSVLHGRRTGRYLEEHRLRTKWTNISDGSLLRHRQSDPGALAVAGSNS